MIKISINKITAPWMTTQFRNYLIIGCSAFVFEYLVFILLLAKSNNLIFTQSTSFLAGLVVSFFGNRRLTFNRKTGNGYAHNGRSQLIRYLILALINLALSNIIIHFLVAMMLPTLIAKIFVMGTIVLWNFVIFGKYIFKTSS